MLGLSTLLMILLGGCASTSNTTSENTVSSDTQPSSIGTSSSQATYMIPDFANTDQAAYGDEAKWGKFHDVPADRIVTCAAKQYDLTFSVDYNDQWGTDQYKLQPCDLKDNSIAFGPLEIGQEGGTGGYFRYNTIQVREKRDANSIVKELQERSVQDIKQETIGGKTVVFSTDQGLAGTYGHWEIIGQKSNYSFQISGCEDQKCITHAETLINSMTFVSAQRITLCPENLSDERELLVQSKLSREAELAFVNAHPEVLNCSPEKPTCYSEFISPERQVSILLPYNPQWGGVAFKIAPFEEYEQQPGAGFGPVCVGEGGGMHRLVQVSIRAKRPPEEAEKAMQQFLQNFCELTPTQRITIGNRAAAMVTGENCPLESPTVFEVFGEKHNYYFEGDTSLALQAAEHLTEL